MPNPALPSHLLTTVLVALAAGFLYYLALNPSDRQEQAVVAIPSYVTVATMDLSQLIDISGLLVTESNPAPQEGTMDAARCAALHNHLVQLEWIASGMALEDLPDRCTTFFTDPDNIDEADEFRDRLSPSLVAFLERARIPQSDSDHHVFAWAHSLATTYDMFRLEELHEDDGDEFQFPLLYVTDPNLTGKPAGLIYDQTRARAFFAMDVDDLNYSHPPDDHEQLWFPLEAVLSTWVHFATIGKVTTAPAGAEPPANALGGWVWHAYSPAQVDTAVAAFDRLTVAIEARMPADAQRPAREGPLLRPGELAAAGVKADSFAYAFLSSVGVPRFSAIAPGLLVPHDGAAFAAAQRFTQLDVTAGGGGDGMDGDEADGVVVPPVLLFAAAGGHTASFDTPNRRYQPINPFWPAVFQDAVAEGDHDTIAGLYSESGTRGRWFFEEAGFRLVLPFTQRETAAEGPDVARLSDGRAVAPGSVAQLFQHGGQRPFGGLDYAQRLERLLDKWRELVEVGVWSVGTEGVEGSIDVFQHASRGGWRDYWIPPGW